jgi:hypothetical protein
MIRYLSLATVAMAAFATARSQERTTQAAPHLGTSGAIRQTDAQSACCRRRRSPPTGSIEPTPPWGRSLAACRRASGKRRNSPLPHENRCPILQHASAT